MNDIVLPQPGGNVLERKLLDIKARIAALVDAMSCRSRATSREEELLVEESEHEQLTPWYYGC